jgi:MFS family permease
LTTQESVGESAAGSTVSPGPWRNGDFRYLMIGSTASNFGYQIAEVAVPLAAVYTVGATSFDVGLMRTFGQLPYLLLTLFVGVLADRWRRRNMLMFADLGRALAIALIPLTYAVHALNVTTLCVIVFLVGTGTVLFDVGSQAFLPRLVDRGQLARGNAQLETVRSTALICGPTLGGVLVSLFNPPLALVSTAAFFLISTFTVWRIHTAEPAVPRTKTSNKPFKQIGEGLGFVARSPVLRSVTVITASFNLLYAGYTAVYLVYLPRTLHLSAVAIGLALAAMGPGLLVGAMFSSALPKRFGYGRVLIICAFVSPALLVGVALLRGSGVATVAELLVLNFLYGCVAQTFTVSLVAIRQAVTPDRFLGRVMATLRFLGVGLVPVGSLFGGLLGSLAGLRTGLLSISLIMCLVPVPFFLVRTALTRIGTELPAIADE